MKKGGGQNGRAPKFGHLTVVSADWSNFFGFPDCFLRTAKGPLHLTEIVTRAAAAGKALDRDSVVSALTKRIRHADRFRRTAPNTFAQKGKLLYRQPAFLLTTDLPRDAAQLRSHGSHRGRAR